MRWASHAARVNLEILFPEKKMQISCVFFLIRDGKLNLVVNLSSGEFVARYGWVFFCFSFYGWFPCSFVCISFCSSGCHFGQGDGQKFMDRNMGFAITTNLKRLYMSYIDIANVCSCWWQWWTTTFVCTDIQWTPLSVLTMGRTILSALGGWVQ